MFIRRSRSILKASTASYRSSNAIAARPNRLPRNTPADGARTSRTWKRLASSSKPDTPVAGAEEPTPEPAPAAGANASPSPDSPPEDVEKADQEKPKRRPRTSASKDSDPPQLPAGLNIIWDPELDETTLSSSPSLPPPELLEEALNNLHITQHPQTQHRACYPSASSPTVEPTMALYCPIEGGEYLVDDTVRELARRTGSDVVVIDAVQLAAGEWGHFGKAANAVKLPRNPLHFPHSPQATAASPRQPLMEEEDDDEVAFSPQQMTVQIIPNLGRARTSRAAAAQDKVKLFFDELVGLPGRAEPTEKSASRKPRIVYIRDLPTLAPSSATWYPHLLEAVRQRRVGPISRPTSPITNPVTIVFGITPPLMPSAHSSSSSGQGLINLLMSRSSPSSVAPPSGKAGRSEKSDWSEDELADKEREKRLRERLRKWEKGDAALQDELPTLSSGPEQFDGTSRPRSGVVVIGGGGQGPMSGLPPFLESALAGRAADPGDGSPGGESTRFFRTSVLVPAYRSLAKERECRIARRCEINELTMRMGVGAIGGVLEAKTVDDVETENAPETVTSDSPTELKPSRHAPEDDMWEDWGRKIEVWSNVKSIADRAVGSVVASRTVQTKGDKLTLDSTPIPWSAVQRAWNAHRSSRELRKAWTKDSSPKTTLEEDIDELSKMNEPEHDELLERVKQDPELEQHEQRLLSCIVDAASMPTSFSQVHLPPHTIDSVRTIVSLPLLHPAAFQQGILKEHGMTGCLLFGPPGTGKSLVVRALAKEAGCRMMAISPSDVMDMYVGEGEKLVKAVFSLARRLSPCVVFLDEVDALFGARQSARESGGAFAHRGVITEFMQEMDGLKSSKEDSVIVIGATNRPFDLDDAVLRRLPRRLLVDLPGVTEREAILKILLRDENLAPDLDLAALAKKAESFSGSDLKHLCVSAALDAVKENVKLPWSYTSSNTSPAPDVPPVLMTAPVDADGEPTADLNIPEPHTRILSLHNFDKALKEITPSSSESLGSLAGLRKWNDEFGEGKKGNKRQQVWGKDRFGFTNRIEKIPEAGRVAAIDAPSSV
ncbi:AAA-domain-containing protein [Athelia psychrophila]|uniref:AAA-domain-containing protein n=1 Tax=Athelia psychrophila TaxID=1759441 RepID=A0A166N9Z1_9AGAM|nr:AAA-domain-containing protein [Fibularhizoctonia sp. CBS 109695]